MAYAVETVRSLEDAFERTGVVRSMAVGRYEGGTELTYEVTGVSAARKGTATVRVEKFVGGGFAGQVYRVEVVDVQCADGPIDGLTPGAVCAMKILVPPSGFSKAFRDTVYAVGFQAPFSLQVNPDAARAGALWQKFLRRGAAEKLGTERAVVDIHATFIDSTIGSCGELSEWVDGRTWRYEVDDELDERARWRLGDPVEDQKSAEYLSKRPFDRRS